ncbi:hypothetical protein A9Q81_10920 [Gammaproteobacteria bacterium 42_54_T18]|nr:hypothetical protein A9Q81_10920 [Gammaproteobacteria bacterium 42_54_T18]
MNITIRSIKAVLVVGFLSFLAGCGGDKILSPENDSVSNVAPEFRIQFKGDVPDTFVAEINGVAIDSSSFTIDGKEAFVQIDINTLQAGDNTFALTDPSDISATFHFDQVGPVIHMLGADGVDPRNVTGYLDDRGGAESISINGVSLPLDEDGNFAGDVGDANIFDAVATDIFGYSTSESYAKLGQSFNPAIAVRVNQQGLDDSLPNAILQLVEALDFNAFITNPISESCSGAVIADACGKFSINDIDLTPGSGVDIQALSGNKIRATIQLSRLDMDTTATTFARCKSFLCGGSGNVFGTINFNGVTTVQNTDISADFIVSINNGNVEVEIVNGTLDVDLPANGLQVDIDFGAVEDVPFVGSLLNTVVNGIINGLVGILSSVIVDIADGFLASPISNLLNDLISNVLPDSIAIPVADTTLNLGFSPEDFSTSSGGFDIILGNSLTIDSVDPDVLPPLGSFYVTGDAPSPYPSTTPDGTGVDLTATVAANLLNQVLTEAYKGGLLNITLDSDDGISIGTIGSIPDFPIDLDGVTNLNITVSGKSSPSIEVVSQTDAADGVVAVNLLDLTLKVNLDFGDGNGLQEVLSTTVDLQSPFDIGVTQDNTLTIGIEAVPVVKVREFRFQLNGITINSGTDGTISNLLTTLAPQLLPKVLDAIGGIPIPAIAGFTLQLADIWNPSATNNAFLSLGGNLVSVTAAAAAPLPFVSAEAVEKNFSLFETVTNAQKRSVTILVDGDNPGEEPLEYRYRINSGHWTIWKQRTSIKLTYLPAGDNIIDVCTRTNMLKEDCIEVPVSVPFAQ